MQNTIIHENRTCWSQRAPGYSLVNQKELLPVQRCAWQETLCHELSAHFPSQEPSALHVLDIGCGPGFFSIILAEQGYDVTAIDLTPAMLEEAKRNAGALRDQILFLEMNAEELTFQDRSFDVIVTRNLTWNLP